MTDDKFKNQLLNTTSKRMQKMMLAEALVCGSDGLIERQEAEGAHQSVISDVIPARGRWEKEYDDARLIALGFELGPGVEGDELFRYAKLPPGWEKKKTDHNMWTAIYDDRGLRRFSLFYKAAFYDRGAGLYWCNAINLNEYHADTFLPPGKPESPAEEEGKMVRVLANLGDDTNGTPFLATPWVPITDEFYRCKEESRAVMRTYLDETYPGWKEPELYWDLVVEGLTVIGEHDG